jgi:hypothetical protein
VNAGGDTVHHGARTEAFERAEVRAFGEQVLIETGQDRAVAIRIVDVDGARWRDHVQPVVERRTRGILQERLEHARRMQARHANQPRVAEIVDRHLGRIRPNRSNHEPAFAVPLGLMRPQHGKRIGVHTAREQLDGRRRQQG